MSKPEFVKGVCRQCGGHLEFPAEAAGSTIECPHCGKATELAGAAPVMTKRSRAALRLVFVAVGLAAALATVFLLTRHTRKASTTENHTAPAKTSNTATTAVPPVIHTNPPPKPEIVTNEFALLPFKLEKTPGSSLVYVTGTLQNLADRQRFGVKIQFDLFDAQTNAVGKASDYQSVFDPHSEWHFKALVIESKAASARFSRVTED